MKFCPLQKVPHRSHTSVLTRCETERVPANIRQELEDYLAMAIEKMV